VNVAPDRRRVWAWALYDFANSAFPTLVGTFVYGTYFTRAIAPDEKTGTGQWSLAVAWSALIVAVLSPYLGALADRGGYRRSFLAAGTGVTILCTALLYFPQRGQVQAALTLFVVASVAFEVANVCYNSILPDLAPPDRIGRISGLGWGLGYVGGLLCLVIALLVFIAPNPPWFGLSKESGAPVRATNLLVAAWFAVFSLPLFFWIRERSPDRKLRLGALIRSANSQFMETFHEIRSRYRHVFRLLLARLVYNDGLVTIFAFGGIYAQGTFSFTLPQVVVFGITLNVAAGLGALAFGWLDDRWGGRKTLLISLSGLLLMSLLAVLAQGAVLFWIAGIGVGVLAGPVQSASRSLMARFVPPTKENEFFGFFAFSGKATAFVGPFLLGRFTTWFDSQRVGVASVTLFFVVGALLLLRVDEREGARLANRVP